MSTPAVSKAASTLNWSLGGLKAPSLSYHFCAASFHTMEQRVRDRDVPSPRAQYRLDPLTLTAADAQSLLKRGAITSFELVGMYLDRIERHNLKGLSLHAGISVIDSPKALEIAQQLDLER